MPIKAFLLLAQAKLPCIPARALEVIRANGGISVTLAGKNETAEAGVVVGKRAENPKSLT